MYEKVSIILPCRNEQEAIGFCLEEIEKTLKQYNLDSEIIVSDSSTDNSAEIASSKGVKVVKHNQEGYGLAIKEGIKNASGEIIIYADVDGTYDFKEIPKFIDALENYDIVIGSRLRGNIENGAMPLSHKIFGIPFINFLLLVLFSIKTSDSQSGYRALRKETFNKLNLKTNGMESATEILIKAKRAKLRIKDISINYFKRRGGISKLKPYRDGLVHLKYIFMQTPMATYFAVGGTLFIIGLLGHLSGQEVGYFLNSATVKILFPFVGVQIFFLGLFAKTHLYIQFEEKDEFIKRFYSVFKLKTAIGLGSLLIIVPLLFKITGGIGMFFDPLFVSIIIGFQIVFNAIILSALSIK